MPYGSERREKLKKKSVKNENLKCFPLKFKRSISY